jgi:nitrogen regulatory protein P-II 1
VPKDHLSKLGITAMTIADITAWAQQRKIVVQCRGIPVSFSLIHRVKIEIFIPDDQLDQVVNTIIEITRTGESGDGLITV